MATRHAVGWGQPGRERLTFRASMNSSERFSLGKRRSYLSYLKPANVVPAIARRVATMLPLLVLALCLSPASAVERIVSTDASLTSAIIDLGAGERLVGVDVTSRLPAAYQGVPRIGYHRALSVEGMVSLRPDLVVASEHAGPPQVLQALDQLEIERLTLPSPLTIDELKGNIVAIARALELETQATVVLADIGERVASLQEQGVRGLRTALLRESDGALRLAGQGTAGQALIELTGGENVVGYSGYRSYSQEAVLALQPELLLIALPEDEAAAGAERWLGDYPMLRHSTAAINGRVSTIRAGALVGGVSTAALDEALAVLERLRREQLAGS